MPTVLVVDDEQLIRWSLAERLKSDSLTVVEAGTAHEALDRFGPDIDLVLLDYRLPDGDGLRVLKKMKSTQPDVHSMLLTDLSSIESGVAFGAVRALPHCRGGGGDAHAARAVAADRLQPGVDGAAYRGKWDRERS